MASGRLKQGLTMALCALLLCAGCRENPSQKNHRQGMQALKRGQYAQGIRLLQQSIKLGGTNVPLAAIYNALGVAYYHLGQTENALGAFESSARQDSKFAEPFYNTGVIMAESGHEARATPCFEMAARLDPTDPRALEYLSRILSRNQRWDNARQVLHDALRRAPREPRILTALALVELQSTNIVRAISCLQEALEHDANYAPALYNLAVVNHVWLKNDSQAAPLFRDYLRLAPQGVGAEKAARALKDIDQLASAAMVGQTPRAVPKVKTEVPAPVPIAVSSPSCEELLRVARKLRQQDRNEAAINNYLLAAREAQRAGKPSVRDQAAREANALCAQNARAHYELGLYWAERSQPDEALAHLKQAAYLSNTWYEAHLALAQVAADQTEYDTAVVSLKKADQSNPTRPEALWTLAQIYDRNLSLTNQARQTYTLFVQRFSADARAREGRERLKALGGVDQSVPSSAPAPTETQTRWRWLFKSRSQKNPES